MRSISNLGGNPGAARKEFRQDGIRDWPVNGQHPSRPDLRLEWASVLISRQLFDAAEVLLICFRREP